jgi:hypothetical protein
MQNRPNARELLRGVVQFLEQDVVPALQEPLRFHSRIAANLLKIVQREWEMENDHLRDEATRLEALLGTDIPPSGKPGNLQTHVLALNEALCREIRAGRADRGSRRTQIVDHIRKTLSETLEITNPKVASREDPNSRG